MNECKYCGKPVKNKYCNVSCQNKHQNTLKADTTYGELKEFTVTCKCCNKEFIIIEREKLHPKKHFYYCSRSCANKRIHTNETKDKISKKLTKNLIKIKPIKIKPVKVYKQIIIKCENCGENFVIPSCRTKRKCCSKKCSMILRNKNSNIASLGGLKSVESQSKRSKNEIKFANLCIQHFNNVETNKPIFNGWDADVIIHDKKIAILWNGKWHYEKLTMKHSLEQVQNRDTIKLKEIINFGYTPYIIKDMGKDNKDFVIAEFNKFLEFLVA